MKKKALVLGGGGFIGANLSKYLIENRDYDVHVVDNFSRNSFDNSILAEYKNNKRLKVLSGDLTLKETYEALDIDYSYVFMLAAVVGVDKVNAIPHEVIRINSLLTLNTLEWLRNTKCKKVVFSSTSENYAGTIQAFNYEVPTPEDVPLTIEDISHPRFSYAVTKILGESGFMNYAREGFFEANIVRYHNVYGPMMGFRHVLPHLAERFMKEENPFLIYGHDQTRSFNFIDDAVIGTVLAAEKGKNLNIYHIGDSHEISIEELVKFVGSLFNYRGVYEFAETFPGSVSRRCPDISKAAKDLNYSPKVNWQDGVKITIDWYKSYLEKQDNQSESFYDQYGISK